MADTPIATSHDASLIDSIEPARQAINACVHCGFCLPTCPTYLLNGEEMDSPRGRIYLADAGLSGRLPVSDRFVRHFDSCLGCLSCVTACPSGVDYAPVIESARALVEQHHRRTWKERFFRWILFATLPYPKRLRLMSSALGLFRSVTPRLESSGWMQRLPEHLAALIRLGAAVPQVPLQEIFMRQRSTPPTPTMPFRDRVGLLTGCVQDAFFDHVNRATIRVFAAEGVETVIPKRSGCCGALALHAGREDEARQFAKQTIAAFEIAGVKKIAVNAAGCGSAMKDYGRLLADDPNWSSRAEMFAKTVRDVTEVLQDLGSPRAQRHPLPLRLAYHDACHLAHGQRVRQQPRDLLNTIPELTLVTPAESEICCGSAGVYNLTEPSTATELGTRKILRIREVQPDAVATANPGCLIQITSIARRQGHLWPILHPIELVDASINGLDVNCLLRRVSARLNFPSQ